MAKCDHKWRVNFPLTKRPQYCLKCKKVVNNTSKQTPLLDKAYKKRTLLKKAKKVTHAQ